MILSRLFAQDFRNLESRDLEFHPTRNIVVGLNGQGKTNLLEAIYFLATTKSFRTTRIASVVRWDAPSVYVRGAAERAGVIRQLSVGIEAGESRRRVLMINEEKVTLARYLDALHVIAYSGARLDVIRGTPDDRRRFIDRGVVAVHPGHVEDLTRYGRILKQRNALLQDVAARRAPASTLDAWDVDLLETGGRIQATRRAFLERLETVFRGILDAQRYHIADVALLYRDSSLDDAQERRGEEIRARTTLAGPQRDQLDILVAGRPAAEVLSGGEAKMIVLFLKFAKLELFRAQFEEPAIFLFDDIDAELDLQILEKLLAGMPHETQVFATSAKERFLEVLEAGPHRRLTIENGRVITAGDFS